MSQSNANPWGRLTDGLTPERVERGQLIFTPETAADALFVVADGRVTLALTEDRRSVQLASVGPNEAFGIVAAAGDPSYDTNAEALVTSHVFRVMRQRLDAARTDGTLALQLLDALAAHRLLVSQKIDEVVFKSVPARLASVLLDLAPTTDSAHPVSVPRHSHRQLAEMINAYRETVTKVINQFRAARLLEIDGSTITLLNRGRLEELAQGW